MRTLTLTQLQKRHTEIISKNNWEETLESREVAIEYESRPDRGDCCECNSQSNITCQYH